MQDRIEPPILMSRLMTFVFSSALVVLAVLVVTLFKMFPLARPQVFFLMTQVRSDLDIYLAPMKPTDERVDDFKRGFIKEYILARNEIVPNAKVMHRKWGNLDDGVVNTWSSPAVYNDFINTKMWTMLMQDNNNITFSCPVEFSQPAISPRGPDEYAVKFSYFCTNNNGQMTKKDYTIVIRLEADEKIKWNERLNNPLGIRVAEYRIESGNGDPLDF